MIPSWFLLGLDVVYREKLCIAIINAYVYHQLNGTLLALEKNGGANNQFTVLL